jgi:hypothetical protein
MIDGGKKIEKVQKTKFRKNKDVKENLNNKMKHHDRSFYRLIKEEKDYVV